MPDEQTLVHETEQVAESAHDQTEVQEQPQRVETKQESPQDRNWREASRALKELRAQNEELRQQLEQLHTRTQQSPEEESAPDDWVTNKRLEKRFRDMEEKIKAREAELVMDRLKARYNDFDDVVTPENIEYLRENDPELAMSLQALKDDPFQQGIAAYKMLKKTEYYQNRDAMKEKKRIDENMNKPVSQNAIRKTTSPLNEANRFDRGLTPELRRQLYQEMVDAAKKS